MMDNLDDPFKYSTIEIPTVLGLLKNILTQYPDNGQILKELIQNAEDAGASVFEVVYDTRLSETVHGNVQQEKFKDIERFVQSPALYTYNNAEFTEDDWRGIAMLSDSIKKEDPLKVGQFGLGFKSVFHFTDFVTIISGERILFMDPSEPEARMCRTLSLSLISMFLTENQCLNLWGKYMKKENIQRGYLPGTIFWFPLRRTESKLSSTIYKSSNVNRLFDSFSVEGPLCLTFLKSLEKISLRTISNNNHTDILHVELEGTSLLDAQQKRKVFKEQLKNRTDNSLSCCYNITIRTQKNCNVSQQEYKILHYLPNVPTISKNHLPLVGIAAPIQPGGIDAKGHIFCCLPLPMESVNKTDLPVQINGYFVLDQNRRHVKWRTEESNEEPDVIWNENLVSDIISDAYFLYLQTFLQETILGLYSKETWYSLLPSIMPTTGRWRLLSQKIWSKLKDMNILYSEVKQRMMSYKEVINSSGLLSIPITLQSSIGKVLQDLQLPLANVPEHVVSSLQSFCCEINSITPALLRQCLKNNNVRINWNPGHLLEYVLSDGCYEDLEGIPLLPLENNNWIKFSRHGQQVYVCTQSEALGLMGLENQLLSTKLNKSIMVHIQKLASRGIVNLIHFVAQSHLKLLLPESVNFIQRNNFQHTNELWLKNVWDLLQHINLQDVQNLTLIPSSVNLNCSSLLSLLAPIIIKHVGMSEELSCSLALLRINVIPELPNYVRHHNLYNYLNKQDGEVIIKLLGTVLSQYSVVNVANNFNVNSTEKQKLAFCNAICSVQYFIPMVEDLLKKLHLFKAFGKNYEKYVCIEEIRDIYPLSITDFPILSPKPLLSISDPLTQTLALRLNAKLLTKEDLCVMALEEVCLFDEIKNLGIYIMKDYQLKENENICRLLKNKRFILSSSGELCMPCELYDPLDCNIDVLKGEDNNTPDKTYREYNDYLKDLGLRSISDMPLEDIVYRFNGIQNSKLDKISLTLKIRALLKVVNIRSDCKELCEKIENVSCLYGEVSRPSGYPSDISWATTTQLYSPKLLKDLKFFAIVGSCIPMIRCKNLDNIANCLKWNIEPSAKEVIKHLTEVVQVCKPTNGIINNSHYDILKKIYQTLNTVVGTENEDHLRVLSEIKFVFTGREFTVPSAVYVPSGKDDLQLLPYMHPLPLELQTFSKLFCSLGCFKTQSLKLYLNVLKQIQTIHDNNNPVDVEHDRNLVISLLMKLLKFKNDIDKSQLLVPVETVKDRLELIDIHQCAYSDQNCEWLDSEELGVRIVHSSVPVNLAKALGVEALNKHLLAEEEAIMEWGQVEPLTTRIHNLLRQYRDGVAVFKELIQNADDAGASSLSFLYDERSSDKAKKRLLTEEMKECQGPALWAYNDVEFTEADFENLCKLGGGTKEFKSTKIGKFGLGFCSVYNITDVPSFVSGSNYIIFDPHQYYLESNRPGVRYNFSKKMNRIMLQKLHGQFQPFEGIFGCQIQKTCKFNGTLFRLPLRTTTQATKSKISDQHYSHKEIIDLLSMFREIAGEILLFTQNIKKISVFYLGKNSSPQEIELLFESTKDGKHKSPIGVDSNYLEMCDKQMESVARYFDNNCWNGNFFGNCYICSIEIRCSEKSKNVLVNSGSKYCKETKVTWIISWHSGIGKAFKLAEKLGGKVLPLGAVALPVCKKKNDWKLMSLKELPLGFYNTSHIHCFLPLPVKMPLPVQVNGFFEVASDRTSLQIRTEDDRFKSDDWNSLLIEDSINEAYLKLVETFKVIGLSKDSLDFTVWPTANLSKNDNDLTIKLAHSFYRTVEDKKSKVFRNQDGWFSLSESCFLVDSLIKKTDINDIIYEFMSEIVKNENKHVMKIPMKYLSGFSKWVMDSLITEESFYTKYFLPNLSFSYISIEKQLKLILHILDSKKGSDYNLQEIPCIPTLPNLRLRKPVDLINPNSELAELFSVDDERFPHEEFLKENRMDKLKDLGMKYHTIDIEMLLERMKTIEKMGCPECAVDRSQRILKYFEYNEDQLKIVSGVLKNEIIRFLPAMPRPPEWPLSLEWKGDKIDTTESKHCNDHVNNRIDQVSFVTPSNLCSSELVEVVGSVLLIHGYFPNKYSFRQKEVCQMLGVIMTVDNLPFISVVDQLKKYAKFSSLDFNDLKSKCFKIYTYMNNKAKVGQYIEDMDKLKCEEILITKCGFIKPILFAMSDPNDCSPALFSVRREGLLGFTELLKALGIPDDFPPGSVFDALMQQQLQFESKILREDEILLISNLVYLLFKTSQIKGNYNINISNLQLPSLDKKLYPVKDLCIEDGDELTCGSFKYLHPKVSYSQEMLKWLGIKEKSKKRLRELSNRMKFGQKEPLTTRLRNILESYPCDTGIMKELVQNADDAGATKIVFIKDLRKLNTEKLFDEKWTPLQGPALCVYNDTCFNEKDLEGIQNLGNSSKIEDPAATGQYGIGFNAVYHLTDAPSFITRGKEVPHYETLCMFDPHCMYDPEATLDSPGVQFKGLDELRKKYPHSFEGYLEELLQEKGTVFRLPLRTYARSELGKIVKPYQLEKLLKDFKSEMESCILFLKNIREISLGHINNGNMNIEYRVSSIIDKQEIVSNINKNIKNRKALGISIDDDYFHNMQRISYKLTVKDGENAETHWLIVQQFGARSGSNVPGDVYQAFKDKRLRMLPQGGVAIPINKISCPLDFKLSCYLPLPTQTGMQFCLNGHFALDHARRNLWTGRDFKDSWNKWLIEEILAPAAIVAIDEWRIGYFSGRINISLSEYKDIIKLYHSLLPDGKKAISDTWKRFTFAFYMNAKEENYDLFDVFVPEADEDGEDIARRVQFPFISYITSSFYTPRDKPKKHIMGKLTWHSLVEEGSFPLYFVEEKIGNAVKGTLRRLGLKLGNRDTYCKVKEAGLEIGEHILRAEVVLSFLLSWNSDKSNKCKLKLNDKIEVTPFLTIENVCEVFCYISPTDKLVDKLDQIPLMVTRDMSLKVFDKQQPVYCTTFNRILPELKEEFLHEEMVSLILRLNLENANVFKHFTLKDFANVLPRVLDRGYFNGNDFRLKENDAHGESWIKHVWKFIEAEIKKDFKSNGRDEVNWDNGKQYLLSVLGNVAIYPININNKKYVTPLNNASLALDLKPGDPTIFKKMPIPCPEPSIEISSKLKLSTNLEHPVEVLNILVHYREKIDCITSENRDLDFTELLEYLSKHSGHFNLNKSMIRSLKIFKDVNHNFCNIDLKFIVPNVDGKLLGILKRFQLEKEIIIVKHWESELILKLYKYLDPTCVKGTLSMYTNYILPNFSKIPIVHHFEILTILRDEFEKIRYTDKDSWNEDTREVVLALKNTAFITAHDSMYLASKFYDPFNPVFKVMECGNLPKEWAKVEWQYFLKLAGMIHEITPQMFVDFASSLTLQSENVKLKSKTLVEFLGSNYKDLKSLITRIKQIEFLVPPKKKPLQELSPYHETQSGLISFDSSAPEKFENLLWTSMCILPDYAWSIFFNYFDSSKEKRQELGVIDHVPEEHLYKHVYNVTNSVSQNGKKLEDVMDVIYKHMTSKTGIPFYNRIIQGNVSIIYLPEKNKFVTSDIVVQFIECEIEPYLYKAPVRYGQYFKLFTDLGVYERPNCDHFVEVLNKVHNVCTNKTLDPEQSKCMKMAMRFLARHLLSLNKIKATVLYLPTKKEILWKSTDMYVSDNSAFERATGRSLDKPLFIGLEALKIHLNSADFVKNLPQCLRPKFLSEIVQEDFDEDIYEVIQSPIPDKIRGFVLSDIFYKAVLRLMNNYNYDGKCLSEEAKGKVKLKLQSLQIIVLKKIVMKLVLNGTYIGSRTNNYHIKKLENTDFFMLYISNASRILYTKILKRALKRLFQELQPAELIIHIMDLVDHIDDPSKIPASLDDENIKTFDELDNGVEIYQTDLGSYLREEFFPLLDNKCGRFHPKELVAMKKYLGDDPEEDNLYVIVQVEKLIKTSNNVMFDEYEIATGDEANPILIVKAHQLYKFVRETNTIPLGENRELVPQNIAEDAEDSVEEGRDENLSAEDSVEEGRDENLSEEEIRRLLRLQLREIWQTTDERERRHLLRRLYLRWHPDKNPMRVELCTRIIQYIQLIVGRLERGIPVTDDDDDQNFTSGTDSGNYRDTFRPPPSSFFNRSGGFHRQRDFRNSDNDSSNNGQRNFRNSDDSSSRNGQRNFRNSDDASSRNGQRNFRNSDNDSSRNGQRNFRNSDNASSRNGQRTMRDPPEARKWMRQAQHDYEEAFSRGLQSTCWNIFMCYQAIEKALKATLFFEDCEKALEIHSGSLKMYSHNLLMILSHITSRDINSTETLLREIENRIGLSSSVVYPNYQGPAFENFSDDDVNFMLDKTGEILQKVNSYIS